MQTSKGSRNQSSLKVRILVKTTLEIIINKMKILCWIRIKLLPVPLVEKRNL